MHNLLLFSPLSLLVFIFIYSLPANRYISFLISSLLPHVYFRVFRGGLPQSRGYGFVEFAHHAHALACLRELNNNPAYTKHSTTGNCTIIQS
jgi:RNA recognition motif. (a.k.a. RRM, RBD, or RNP domain)